MIYQIITDATADLNEELLEGLPEDVVVTGALSREEGENVGTYAITQGTLSVEGDYEIQFIGADLMIIKADATVLKAPEPAGTQEAPVE